MHYYEIYLNNLIDSQRNEAYFNFITLALQ